ncbi:MAG: RNA-guided endonuclease InsQ/TnpB family protein [bacterium]
MQTIRTIRCKLFVDSADVSTLKELFKRYASACSEIAQWGRDNGESNAIRLHHALYYSIREKHGLPANLAVTALRRAAGSLKTANGSGKFEFRPTFVALDERTFTLKGESVSFSTHTGKRIKAALDIGNYQREALAGQEPTSATLVKTHDGFCINIVVNSEVANASGGAFGIDLGIRNIAVTSAGTKFDGKPIRKYREFRWKIRASLQSNGSRGAKKVLRQLSGKEARRAAWVNHNIAKAIIDEAVKSGCSVIRMEDLKGIRDRLRVPNKHRNRMMGLWAFFQLQEFVRYKAAMKGVGFERINPAYSSQTHYKCGKRGLRDHEVFVCTTCGESLDADENAAKVIAAGGASVNTPESTGHQTSKSKAPLFRAG